MRVAVFIATLLSVSVVHAAEPADEAAIRFFREKIEPVLKAECYNCHSVDAKEIQGGLLLDSRGGARRGGDTGPAVAPGKVKESLLIQAIRHEGDLAMPPEMPKLAEKTIADFVKWIEIGAPDPREEKDVPGKTPAADPRLHWSFQQVRKVAPPAVKNPAWVKSPIDGFILARLEQKDWQPAPPASRSQWIRRVYFDLTGLPPSPEEIAAFVHDSSPHAYEQVVDRLLSSPRYGERWAQHWLDVVRYAETEGYEYDRHVPDAWRYRDYVIDAFNRDKPFDRFLTEQIAGDEIDSGNRECQTASIFHRLGPVRRNAGNADIALSRNEVLTERTDVIGTAILGLTVGCARCHNHKLEPISQRDYYRLQAYLAATDEHDIVLASADERKAWEAKADEVKREMKRLRTEAQEAKGAEKARLTDALEAIEDQMPPPLPTIPSTWNNFGGRTAIHVLKRGVWENKGETVGPRPLSVLVAHDLPQLPADVADPRTQLARWLTASDHPLTARVLVNRLWQQHFGVGLVKTANDFGVRGERPSHPELLDWLAATLVENGWRLKPLHRMMVLSSAYRQSSQTSSAAKAEEIDPEDRLLWRFNRRRLTAEEIRDAMLTVSGRLNLKAGGPSVMLPVDAELVKQLYKPLQWQVAASEAEYDRRSVYLIAKRNLRLPFFETFDAPALLTSCARRESSTHAPQALEMLNGRFSNELAEAFARRLERESDGVPERTVDRAFWLALGRSPTTEERRLAIAFLREQPLREFALALFNLNEFLYVP
jgi:hypothetical protein